MYSGSLKKVYLQSQGSGCPPGVMMGPVICHSTPAVIPTTTASLSTKWSWASVSGQLLMSCSLFVAGPYRDYASRVSLLFLRGFAAITASGVTPLFLRGVAAISASGVTPPYLQGLTAITPQGLTAITPSSVPELPSRPKFTSVPRAVWRRRVALPPCEVD